MSFENPTNIESEKNQLSLPEAQKEANMLRAQLGMDYWGKIKTSHDFYPERPRSEDYQNALEAIEEMRRSAEEEPSMEKLKSKLLRIAEGTKLGVKFLLLLPIMNEEEENWMMADHKETMNQLSDASDQLKKLKEKAEKYENPDEQLEEQIRKDEREKRV